MGVGPRERRGERENLKPASHHQRGGRLRVWIHQLWDHNLKRNEESEAPPTEPLRCPNNLCLLIGKIKSFSSNMIIDIGFKCIILLCVLCLICSLFPFSSFYTFFWIHCTFLMMIFYPLCWLFSDSFCFVILETYSGFIENIFLSYYSLPSSEFTPLTFYLFPPSLYAIVVIHLTFTYF